MSWQSAPVPRSAQISAQPSPASAPVVEYPAARAAHPPQAPAGSPRTATAAHRHPAHTTPASRSSTARHACMSREQNIFPIYICTCTCAASQTTPRPAASPRRPAPAAETRALSVGGFEGANACKWMSRGPGVGGSAAMGDSGGGCTWIARSAPETDEREPVRA